MLAQRAAKTNNFWNRLVRQGSTMRRISLFGANLCILLALHALTGLDPGSKQIHADIFLLRRRHSIPVHRGDHAARLADVLLLQPIDGVAGIACRF